MGPDGVPLPPPPLPVTDKYGGGTQPASGSGLRKPPGGAAPHGPSAVAVYRTAVERGRAGPAQRAGGDLRPGAHNDSAHGQSRTVLLPPVACAG